MDPQNNGCSNGDHLFGRYANYFAVGCNEYEFVIDFGQSYSENAPPELWTRIVTVPVYAKALLKTLQGSIETFETTYGSISDADPESSEY